MKLPDLRKALRSPKEPEPDFETSVKEAREFHKENLCGIEVIHVEHIKGTPDPGVLSRAAAFHFSDEKARLSAFFSSSDVGKIAYQVDNGKLYVLASIDTTERIMKGACIWKEVLT